MKLISEYTNNYNDMLRCTNKSWPQYPVIVANFINK